MTLHMNILLRIWGALELSIGEFCKAHCLENDISYFK